MDGTPRTQHPFYMYDNVRAIPDAFASVTCRMEGAAGEFARGIADHDRVYLVGIGTSHHAAQAGKYLMQEFGGGLPAEAWQSFDFTLYGPRLSPRDVVIVISHRGNKHYSWEAVRRAKEKGCLTALITGEGEPAAAIDADVTFSTVPQERSSAHTYSYVGSIAALAVIAKHVGIHRSSPHTLAGGFLREDMPMALRAAIDHEIEMERWAKEFATRRRFWLVGGGPSAITAQEVALKIKETSYLQAEGLSVEAMLHGPFQCVESDDLFVLIAPRGAAQSRVFELCGMVQEVGALFVVVSDGPPKSLWDNARGWCVVPEVPEPLCVLSCLGPLLHFTYHLAMVRGTNPDGFRLDDRRFLRAGSLVKL